MGFPFRKFYAYLLLLFFLVILELTPPSKSTPDYATLVYKGCGKQPLSDPNALHSLFTSLFQQSSRSKFFKTSTAGGGSQRSIFGLFQCRGDLTNADCYNCVSKLPQLSDQICGQVSSARVQLLGCYMLYDVSELSQTSGVELLYKECGRADSGTMEFVMKRDSALTVMQNGLASGNGFSVANYQSVYALGQCQGDLSIVDCGRCVKAAAQKAQIECGGYHSAQVYLYKCFMSYSYYPNGTPTKSSSYSSSGYSSAGSGQTRGKTAAIIVGATVGAGFLIICVLFVRGLKKKDEDF